RVRDESVQAGPLSPVVAVADDEPAIAVGGEHAPPLPAEFRGQGPRPALGGGKAAPPQPVRGRGDDHGHLPRRDGAETAAVSHDEPPPAVRGRIRGHRGYGMNSSAISTSPSNDCRASSARAAGAS